MVAALEPDITDRGAAMMVRSAEAAELYQIYVSAEARGSGAAATLVADAEARLAEAGVELAWLACAIGNGRAARSYEKCGWQRAGTVVYQPDAANDERLEVWRFEKPLS